MTPSALSNETTELDQDALEAAIRALLPEGWASAWGTESHDWMRARGYAITAISAYSAALSPSTERGETIEGWRSDMENAPRDGSEFLVEADGRVTWCQHVAMTPQEIYNETERLQQSPESTEGWVTGVDYFDIEDERGPKLWRPMPPRALNPSGSGERG
jgi:hypothetical protein